MPNITYIYCTSSLPTVSVFNFPVLPTCQDRCFSQLPLANLFDGSGTLEALVQS